MLVVRAHPHGLYMYSQEGTGTHMGTGGVVAPRLGEFLRGEIHVTSRRLWSRGFNTLSAEYSMTILGWKSSCRFACRCLVVPASTTPRLPSLAVHAPALLPQSALTRIHALNLHNSLALPPLCIALTPCVPSIAPSFACCLPPQHLLSAIHLSPPSPFHLPTSVLCLRPQPF